jgi:hypothetical protein
MAQHVHTTKLPPPRIQPGSMWVDTSDPLHPVCHIRRIDGTYFTLSYINFNLSDLYDSDLGSIVIG